MPHIIVKLWPGRSEDQKKQMTDKIVKVIKNTRVPLKVLFP